MGAILVSRIKVKDPEQMKAYGAAAAPTIKAHGGEILMRGRFTESLIGTDEPHATGVIKFPDTDTARTWFASPEYQSLAQIRDAAGEMEFLLYDLL